MDPRRIELSRRHTHEMGLLFTQFLEENPDADIDVIGDPEAGGGAWTAYSAALLARHQAERAALAEEIEAEQRSRSNATTVNGHHDAPMEASQAISLVTKWIRSRGLHYPTEGLKAERFSVGWSVYAPVEIDESDPMSFLKIPVGRSIFLIGDSGRIKETTSSIPPRQARAEFAAEERAMKGTSAETNTGLAEFDRELNIGQPVSATTVAQTADGPDLLDLIVQQLAALGPVGWEEFTAEFALTASSEVAQLEFRSGDRTGLVPVPQSIAEQVRQHRQGTATVPAGPWWRLLLTSTNTGEATVDYDYGDEPFPEGQLVAAEHYRADLETYPRAHVPVWLAGYVAGPEAQGRDARAAAAAGNAGHVAVPAENLPALNDLWARWAVLSAVHAGTGSAARLGIHPGYASYENDDRSGATLFVLPGDRAVLSGGKLNSELLDAAYNGGQSMPELYTGAPAWVTDSVINYRNRNGLLTFCFWWMDGGWCRGVTDTSGELGAATPPVLTADETIRAMVEQIGTDAEAQCASLLVAVANRAATPADVAAVFANRSDADIDTAINQLSLAGLLAP
ncbi:hypothetical protein [Mycolicibacterium sp. XJ870]